jgi:hypothetical protein
MDGVVICARFSMDRIYKGPLEIQALHSAGKRPALFHHLQNAARHRKEH